MSAKRKPIMIGAHVPKHGNKVPWRRAKRCTLCESAELINRAFDRRVAQQRPGFVWARDTFNP